MSSCLGRQRHILSQGLYLFFPSLLFRFLDRRFSQYFPTQTVLLPMSVSVNQWVLNCTMQLSYFSADGWANHGKNWIATWIFGIYKCHLRKIPSSSELSKGECSKVRSSISPTKLAAKISRSQLFSISVPSFLWSFF